MYIYVYIYIYTHLYIHIYIHIHRCLSRKSARHILTLLLYSHTCAFVQKHSQTLARAHIHTRLPSNTHSLAHPHSQELASSFEKAVSSGNKIEQHTQQHTLRPTVSSEDGMERLVVAQVASAVGGAREKIHIVSLLVLCVYTLCMYVTYFVYHIYGSHECMSYIQE